MSPPPNQPKRPKVAPPPDEGDTYAVSEPTKPEAPPVPAVPAYLDRRPLPVETAEPVPEPPRLPFFTGVFEFPFYLRSLAAWAMVSIGLTISALGIVLCIHLVDIGMTLAVRCIGLPVLLITTFSLSYAAACFMEVVEVTSQGYDKVVDWPAGLWREWFWTFLSIGWAWGLAAAAGGVVGKLTGFGVAPGLLAGVYLLFPIFFVSSMEAGSAMVLIAWPILRSFKSVWWAWGLFYVEAAALMAAWLVPTVLAFQNVHQPYLTVLVAGPFLGAAILIYARMLGRLLWCFGQYLSEDSGD
jgi:hypothetical protein